MEKWDKIPGYSRYEASTMGRIKTFDWKGHGKEAILKPALDNSGYLRTMLKNDFGKTETIKVHRIIAITFLGLPKQREEVNHKNSIRSDNRIVNLEWCSHSDNMRHSFACGKSSNTGERNPASTLSDNDVIEIRKNYNYGRKSRHEEGMTKPEIAKKYKTSVSVIKMIIQGRTWKHLL